MLGDTAVAVHPERRALPAPHRQDGDDPAASAATFRSSPTACWSIQKLGTGCVKVTPAHDPNDYACGLRHKLPMINILNPDGTINANGGNYAGLDRYKARERVTEEMEKLGFFEGREDRDIPLKHSDRSKTPIEPYLSDQWFVKMDDAGARPAMRRGERRPGEVLPGALHRTPTSTGSARSATGASAGNCGGGTAFRSGTLQLSARRELKACASPAANDVQPGDVWTMRNNGRWLTSAPADDDLPADALVLRSIALRARPRRARHLVQLRPLAALDARLAGADAGAALLLPDQRAGDEPRHHHALGGAHGDDRSLQRRQSAVPSRLHPPEDPRRLRRDDEQDEGQRHRSARHHRALRHRRPALQHGLPGHRDPGQPDAGGQRLSALRHARAGEAGAHVHADAEGDLSEVQEAVPARRPLAGRRSGTADGEAGVGALRDRPQLRQQALERRPLPAAEPGRLHAGAGARRRSCRSRIAGFSAGWRRPRRR